ncbi:MAG: GNAT family N-acetyltransferase [Ignavibacteriales bacterium]|nr:GNAT family N-acetyltransferase [Ignavibacteriales bacterium]
MKIELKRLTDIDTSDLVDLMNQPLLRRHMPLLGNSFSEEDCIKFVEAKEKLWQEYGYGPWAFVVDGELAGWGGLQPEDGDADLALVIHPRFWGIGPHLCERIIRIGFEDMHLESLTMLLPPSRSIIKGILRLGFVEDGDAQVGGERFVRYRLHSHRAAKYRGRA